MFLLFPIDSEIQLSFDAFFPPFQLAESPPRDLQQLPTNNGLLMRSTA